MFKKKLTLVQFVTINILLVSLIFMSIFYFLWVRYEAQRFSKAIQDAQSIYLEGKRQALKTIVEQFYSFMKEEAKHEKVRLFEKIDMFFSTVKYFKNLKELETACFDFKKQNNLIDFLCVKEGKILFVSKKNLKLNSVKNSKKIFVFKKLYIRKLNANLFLVVFEKEFNMGMREKLLNMFKGVSFDYSGYIFIVDTNGKILLSAHKLMNKKLSEMSDKFGKETERIILDKAIRQGHGFVEYTWFKPDLKKVSRKVSYLKFDKDLKWILGAGIYLDDVEKSFAPIYNKIKIKHRTNITQITFLMFITLLLDLGFLLATLRVKFGSDYKKISGLLDNFEDLSEEEINYFNCGELTFMETCKFASRLKTNLIEIKRAHRDLLKLNRQLKEIGEKFKALAEQISNGVVIIDRDLNIEFVNQEFCRIFEYSENTFEGKNFLVLFPVGIRRKILEAIEHTLGKKENKEIPRLKLNVKGREKFLEIHFSPLETEDSLKVICTITDTTEKEKLLERLRFLATQYEKAEKMAKVGNWIYYPETKKFWASNEAFRIYEIDITEDNMVPASLINSKIFESDLVIALKTTLEPLKNKVSYEGVFRIVPEKGRIKYVISKGEPIFDEEGNVFRVDGVVKDVTDLKQIEQELQKHIAILEKTQLLSKLGYWEYDFKKQEFSIYSSFFKKVLNRVKIPKDELLDYVVDEDRETIEKIIQSDFEKEGELSGTIKVFLPNYNKMAYLYFESDELIEDTGGKKRVGWVQDITSFKKLEEEIEIEKEKLIRTINALNEGVALLDKNLHFIFLNESFTKIFRKKPGKENLIRFLNNVGIKNLPADLSVENFEKVFNTPLKGVLSFEDAEVIISMNMKPLRKSEDFKGYVFVIEDITSKEKYTEEVIKTQNMRLLNKVAASLAHDLNNLLGSILGKVSILEKEVKNTKIERDLAKVLRNINIARTLATQFLAFSKSGKPLVVNIEKATLNQIIADLSEFVFSGSSIEVNIDIEENLWSVKGDKTQIAQIVLNLFSNARSVLNEKGRVEVVVKNCRNKKPLPYCSEGDYILIKVTDNGPGIPEDKLKTIFEFFVGYKKEGFGLGLAIVKSIVDSHGGCLDVYSEEGKGATFFVYLPAVKPEKKNELSLIQPGVARKLGKKEKKVSLKNLKIAVLEDELPMQETIFDLLDYLEIKGEIFSKGEELIEAIKTNLKTKDRYNVALLDLTIKGGLGGKEVVQILKKIDPDIITIVSSGYSKDPIVANYVEYGFDGALPKPYSLSEFESVLRNIAKKIKGT